jgi:transglutaminase-like putative cysteine protease
MRFIRSVTAPIAGFFKSRAFIPFFLLILVVFLLALTSRFIEKPPRIDSIEPSVAPVGSVVTLRGEHFGTERNGGMVTLAGSRIVSSGYAKWQDDVVQFIVPANAGSGMVVLSTEKGKSNGVLFANKAQVPVVLSGPARPGMPYIETIEPSQGAVGSMVVIRGLNFGFDRGNSKVLFFQQDLSEQSRFEGSQPERRAASLIDYDYESWNDQEIRVYVPDGAASGGISINSDRGFSNSVFFEVKEGPGVKQFTSRRGYQITYDVDIFSPQGTPDAVLDLWIPGLFNGLEQRDVEWTPEPAPLWDDYYGAIRYHLEGITESEDRRITQNYWFERYSLETRITPSLVKNSYNTERELYKVYTGSDSMVKVTEELQSLAVGLTRRQANPYLKARILYDHLLKNLTFSNTVIGISPENALERGESDALGYALLFTALARGAGIPTRPVAGFIVYNDKLTLRHYWAEFYLEGFGWVPVDPVLGGGAQFGNFPSLEEEKPSDYYFGNLDNQHITFSRGVTPVRPMLSQGETRVQPFIYGLQTFHEEASGLESYETRWSNIRIIEWW